MFWLTLVIITEKRNSRSFFRCPLIKMTLKTHCLILFEVIFHEICRCVVHDLGFKMFRFFIFSPFFQPMTQMVSFLLWGRVIRHCLGGLASKAGVGSGGETAAALLRLRGAENSATVLQCSRKSYNGGSFSQSFLQRAGQ